MADPQVVEIGINPIEFERDVDSRTNYAASRNSGRAPAVAHANPALRAVGGRFAGRGPSGSRFLGVARDRLWARAGRRGANGPLVHRRFGRGSRVRLACRAETGAQFGQPVAGARAGAEISSTERPVDYGRRAR